MHYFERLIITLNLASQSVVANILSFMKVLFINLVEDGSEVWITIGAVSVCQSHPNHINCKKLTKFWLLTFYGYGDTAPDNKSEKRTQFSFIFGKWSLVSPLLPGSPSRISGQDGCGVGTISASYEGRTYCKFICDLFTATSLLTCQ